MPRPHKTNVQFLYIRIVWYNCMYAVCCVYLSFVCLSRFVWAMDMDDDCAVIMFRCMHVCVWAFCCNDRQTVKQARVERHTEAYMQKAHAPIVCVCVSGQAGLYLPMFFFLISTSLVCYYFFGTNSENIKWMHIVEPAIIWMIKVLYSLCTETRMLARPIARIRAYVR